VKWGLWTSTVLGLWLAVAPFVTGYSAQAAATIEAVVVGLLIAGCSMWAAPIASTPAYLSYGLMVCGLWSIVAPFVLGYRDAQMALYNDVGVGLLVIGCAIAEIVIGARTLRPKTA